MTAKDKELERRKHARREVLETFHVFVVIPKVGPQKLYLADLSEGGFAMNADEDAHLKAQDAYSGFFYINPSLKLPLSFKVAHIAPQADGAQRIGCEFNDPTSKAYKSYVKFLHLLDDLAAFLDQ